MRQRVIGSLTVSIVGLGCNNLGGRLEAAESERVVRAALDAGVTLFDTADRYGEGRSEEILGAALGDRRDEAIIATKFGLQMGDDPARQGASPDWITTAVEDSLRRLGTDYIDLYQLHRPDEDVPIEETLGALDELVHAGKVREIGCSNFSGRQIDEAETAARDHALARFVSAQNHWNLLHRDVEDEVIPACRRHGLAVLPYYPLASGVLTGKYELGEEPPPGTRLGSIPRERAQRFLNEENLRTTAELESFAERRGHTLLELAISWLASDDVVASVIAGATTPDQVHANVAAAGWELPPDDRREIDQITSQA
ncbi:MAG: aldo/keto reductase [Nitriliruptorales bacterium]|nr:aldo/keto reductase [Nitriliruptorales bacterium]